MDYDGTVVKNSPHPSLPPPFEYLFESGEAVYGYGHSSVNAIDAGYFCQPETANFVSHDTEPQVRKKNAMVGSV